MAPLRRERLIESAAGDAHRDAYYIDGKIFSFGDKLSFKDMRGSELALIDQKLLSIGPQYEIIRGGATVAVVPDRWLQRAASPDLPTARCSTTRASRPSPGSSFVAAIRPRTAMTSSVR